MANKVFGTMPDGKEIELIVLKNANGTEVQAIGYGARLVKVLTKDKDGNLGDVILGYNDLESYFGMDFQGAVVGRFANRISNGSFEIDGVKYTLTHGHRYNETNLPENCGDVLLHGHTHVPACEEIADTGIMYMNPGSVSIPKEDSEHGYMIINEDTIVWKNLQGKSIRNIR